MFNGSTPAGLFDISPKSKKMGRPEGRPALKDMNQ